jgi:hypothetical protein
MHLALALPELIPYIAQHLDQPDLTILRMHERRSFGVIL